MGISELIFVPACLLTIGLPWKIQSNTKCEAPTAGAKTDQRFMYSFYHIMKTKICSLTFGVSMSVNLAPWTLNDRLRQHQGEAAPRKCVACVKHSGTPSLPSLSSLPSTIIITNESNNYHQLTEVFRSYLLSTNSYLSYSPGFILV